MGLDPVTQILEQLDRGQLAEPLAVVAYLAGQSVELPQGELHAARRRAMLLLAAGGDPHRELEVDEPAVKALAADLWNEERQGSFAAGLDVLAVQARELARARETVIHLAGDLDLAWRLFALSLLAEELADD